MTNIIISRFAQITVWESCVQDRNGDTFNDFFFDKLSALNSADRSACSAPNPDRRTIYINSYDIDCSEIEDGTIDFDSPVTAEALYNALADELGWLDPTTSETVKSPAGESVKVTEYNAVELADRVYIDRHDEQTVKDLAEWCERYGDRYFNGEDYTLKMDGFTVYLKPVYEESGEDEWQLIDYDVTIL